VKVYRKVGAPDSPRELAERKAEAQRLGGVLYPDAARVEVHAYYGGRFFVAVWGHGAKAADVVVVGA
jgi:hypothetical protein